MIYAVEPKSKTPIPFLELRVFIITGRKQNWDKIFPTLEEILDRLEWLLGGVMRARMKGSIFYKYSLEGTEKNVLIDIDEAKSYLATTGLINAKFGEFYRFASFVNKMSYNEREIRTLSRPEISFGEWITQAVFHEKESPEESWE